MVEEAAPKNESESSSEDSKNNLEHYRLAGTKPLKTVMYLSLGPIIAQVAGALKGIVSTVWISAALGETALAAISTVGVYDGISRSFGFFMSSSGASKISQLYGEHREDEASQVIVDIIRISIIMGIIVPAILSPTAKPLARWFGTTEEVGDLAYIYLLPINIMTFSMILFLGLGGCMQGEGRSMFFSILNLVALIVNCVVLDPLLMIGLKTGIWGASFGQAFSEFVPFVIIFVMYFMGKFAVKPKFVQFLKPFSPHTLPSLSVGLSQLVINLSTLIPAILVRKFMGLSYPPEVYNDALAGYNTTVRYVTLATSVLIAMTMGYVPAASYAYAAKNLRRWIRLTIHLNWVSFLWSLFVSILTLAIPRQLSLIFGHSEGYLKEATNILFIGNCCGAIMFARYTGIAILQSLQMGRVASILSFLSLFVSLVAFTCILYYTDKHNGDRIIYCYNLSYVFGFVANFFVLVSPMTKIIKAVKLQNQEEEDQLEALEDQTLEIKNEKSSPKSSEIEANAEITESSVVLPGEESAEE